MSCLEGHIKRHGLIGSIVRETQHCAIIEPIRLVVGMARQLFFVEAQQIRPIISLTKSCRSSIGASINVYPSVVWLTEDNDYSGYFKVTSNTDWIIQKEE